MLNTHSCNAHAKVNIFLKITGFDKNTKYHNLYSLCVKIQDLYDVVSVTIDVAWSCSITLGENLEKYKTNIDDDVINIQNFIIKLSKSFILYLKGIYPELDSLSNLPNSSFVNDSISNLINNLSGIKITIKKNIPISAGLGGGSSCNIAILKCILNTLSIPIDVLSRDDARMFIIQHIGMDGVFAASNYNCAVMRGAGDIIEPINNYDLWCALRIVDDEKQDGAWKNRALKNRADHDDLVKGELDDASSLQPMGIVLINPGVVMSTREVYAKYDNICASRDVVVHDQVHNQVHNQVHGQEIVLYDKRTWGNCLYASAVSMQPIISEIINAISIQQVVPKQYNKLLYSNITGSGATCFGIFDTEQQANDVARYVAKKNNLWWCVSSCLTL